MQYDPHTGLDVRFLARVLEFEGRLEQAGLRFRMECGFRSIAGQTIRYARGRISNGPILTDNAPGQSYHQFGLAADYVHEYTRGVKNEKEWAKFGEIARGCNLVWGGDMEPMRDPGHVQYPGPTPCRSGQKLSSEN